MGTVLETLSVTVNGEAMDVPSGTTVSGLIALMGLDTRKVAVERNLEIVPRSLHGVTVLASGDELEIVHFVGGG